MMEVSKEKSIALRVLRTLARLRREYDNATPSLEEQGDAVYMDWAYRMGDAWEQAYAIVDALPVGADNEVVPSPNVDPIDTYQLSVEMGGEIRHNALTAGVAPPCIYRTGCQEADKCAKAEHCTAPIGDDFSGCRPPMRHITGVNEETLRSAGGVALGEDGLCKSCGYEHWCRKHGKCYRGVKGDGNG